MTMLEKLIETAKTLKAQGKTDAEISKVLFNTKGARLRSIKLAMTAISVIAT